LVSAKFEEKNKMLHSLEAALQLAHEQRQSLAEKVRMIEEQVDEERKGLESRVARCQDALTKMSGQVWNEDQSMASWRQDVGAKQSELRILQTKSESRKRELEGLKSVLPGVELKLKTDVNTAAKRVDERNKAFLLTMKESEKQGKAITKCYQEQRETQDALDMVLRSTTTLSQQVAVRSEAHARMVTQSEQIRNKINKVDAKLDTEAQIADELFVTLNDAEGKGNYLARMLHDSQKALHASNQDLTQALDDKSMLLAMESGQKTKFSQIMSTMHDQFMVLRNNLLDKTEENEALEGEIIAQQRASLHQQTKLQMMDMLNNDEINDFENFQRDVRRKFIEASNLSNQEDMKLMAIQRQIKKAQDGSHELSLKVKEVIEADKRMKNNINMHNSETKQIQERVESKDRTFPILQQKLNALNEEEQMLDAEVTESDVKLEHALKQVKRADHQKRMVTRQLMEKQEREDRILADIEAVKGKIKDVGVQDNIKELLARARLRSFNRQ